MTTIIYLELQNEGTDVWRPVEAEPMGGNRYKIISDRPEDEDWPVGRDQIVECEFKALSGGDCLAVKVGQISKPSLRGA
jgi:hypothetical protein